MKKILFATARPFFPDLFGGAERSMHQLLRGLKDRGHSCRGLAVLGQPAKVRCLWMLRALTMRRIQSLSDGTAGFKVRRTHSWLVYDVFEKMLRSERPDVVVSQLSGAGEFAERALRHGIRSVIFLRDMDHVPFSDNHAADGRISFIANSRALAGWARERFGIEASVIYPPIDVTGFRPAATPKFVTFINPIPEKGLDLAIDIARNAPDVPFLFVESWPLRAEEMQQLKSKIAGLQNVTFLARRERVQEVYDLTTLLIVPSKWAEAFGRVVVEAQACGIPVFGRDVGGIPEAIGGGGKLLPAAAEAAEWADEIRALLQPGGAELAKLRFAAIENAHRREWNIDTALEGIERLFRMHERPADDERTFGLSTNAHLEQRGHSSDQ